MEYVIAFAQTVVPNLLYGLFAWFAISAIMKQFKEFKGKPVYKNNLWYLGVYSLIAFVMAASSTSISYKHQTFDADQESYQIELIKQQDNERTDLVIEDRTRNDYTVTDQEWKDNSSYSKGVQ